MAWRTLSLSLSLSLISCRIGPLFLGWLITPKGHIGHRNVCQLDTYQRSNKESNERQISWKKILEFLLSLNFKTGPNEIQMTKRSSSLCNHLISKKGPDEIQMSGPMKFKCLKENPWVCVFLSIKSFLAGQSHRTQFPLNYECITGVQFHLKDPPWMVVWYKSWFTW